MKALDSSPTTNVFVVLGAGPSGLASAYKLCVLNPQATVYLVEKSSKVGGLSSSFEWEGCRIDYGPHRLSGGLSEIIVFLKKLLGSNLKEISLTHKVLFNNHFYDFPINFKNLAEPRTLWLGFRAFTSLIFTNAKMVLFASQTKNFDTQLKKVVGEFLYSRLINEMLTKVWPGNSKDYDTSFVKIRFSVISLVEIIRVFIKSRGLNTTPSFYPVGGYGTICESILKELYKLPNFHFLPNSYISEVSLNAEMSQLVGLSVISEKGTQVLTGNNIHLISSIPLNDLASLLTINSDLESTNKESKETLEIVSLRLYCFLFDQDQTLEASTYIFPNKNPRVNRLFEQNLYEKSSVPAGKSLIVGDLSFICGSKAIESLPTPDEIFEDLATLGIFDKTKLLKSTFLDIPHAYLRPSQKNSVELKNLKQSVSAIQNVHLVGRFGAGVYNNLDYALLSGFDLARWLADTSATKIAARNDWNNHHKIFN